MINRHAKRPSSHLSGCYFWRKLGGATPGAKAPEDGVGMQVYDFEVLKDDAIIAACMPKQIPRSPKSRKINLSTGKSAKSG